MAESPRKDILARYRRTEKYRRTQERYFESDKGQAYLAKKRHRHRAKRLKKEQEGTFTAYEWRSILWAYKNHCAYCDVKETKENPLTIDHIQPLLRGGTHSKDNVVPACKFCNEQKGDHPWLPNPPQGKLRF